MIIGGLMPVLFSLFFGAALWGLGMLLRRPKHQEGPRVKDREVQVSSYGVPMPVLYGQCKTGMALIYADKLIEHSHTQNVGKGGGDSVTTYTYSDTFAGAFGAVPDPAVFGEMLLLKLYIDEKLAYNAMADSDKVTESGAFKRFKFYSGSDTQLPDPTLEAKLGADNVPAYRGRCYGVFKDLNVTPYGNRVPTIRALVGPGTPTAAGKYDVQGFNSPDGGLIYALGMVMHPDGIHLVIGYANYGATPDYVWQLVNTYTRQTVAEKIYYAPDPNCTGVTDCPNPDSCSPFGNYNEFDLDECGNIYAVSCEERGYVCRLDSATFTVQDASSISAMEDDSLAGIYLRVSKNPLFPYIWLSNEPVDPNYTFGVYLFDRNTLSSPMGGPGFGHFFPAIADTNTSLGISQVNASDGSVYALTKATGAIIYLSRFYPDGIREDNNITSLMPAGFTGNITMRLIYDPDSDQLIFPYQDATGYQLAFFDSSAYSYNGTTSGLNLQVAESHAIALRGVQNGHLYWADATSGNILKINILTRQVVEEWDDFSTDFLGGLIYLPYKSSLYVEVDDVNHYLQELTVGRLTAGTARLDNIVTDICQRAGLESGQINVAQLTDEVKGYMLNEDQDVRDSLEPLMACFIFDGAEVDGVLQFVKRGSASTATIPETDLAAHIGEEFPEPLEIEYPEEAELPRRTEVFYLDINRKHEQGVQHYGRQETDSKYIKRIDSPVLMDADYAKQLAHISFKYDWQAKPCSFSLGPKYAQLVPTDVVTIQKSEGDYRVLLLEAKREGLLTHWKGIIEDLDYSSAATGDTGPLPDEEVDFPGPSIWHLMDLPPLLDAHNQAGAYLASGALFDDWTGCNIWVSKDGGDTWQWLKDLTARATTGIATAALGDFAYQCIDNGNSLTVRWDKSGDALEDKTTTEWWNGQAHYLLVGDEIICAKDVTTNADSTQTFGPPLIRGTRGTEYTMTGHTAGERVVLLNLSTVFFANMDSSYLNQSYLYNGISHGDQWADGVQRLLTTELHTLKPWAGVQAEGSRDGSNNLTITWRRRDRFGHLNPLRAGVEVPMSEATESYEVDILLSGSVVRTITGLTNESASYTAAQQSADGYTPGDPVDCEIFQLSATIGRGWELASTI